MSTSPLFPCNVPTIEDVLARTSIGGEFHRWAVEGGSIRLTTSQLRAALDAAYDSANPEWQQFVEVQQDDDDQD